MRTRLPYVLIQLALAVCVLWALELGWRVFALTQFLEFQAQAAPASAESISTQLAPLLTSRDAEKIYATVQSQHVALHQQYELTIGLAQSARQTSLIAFGAALVTALLTCSALWFLRPSAAAVTEK